MLSLIVVGILGIFVGSFLKFEDNCPRRIRGYSCAGKLCDHSELAVARSRYEMLIPEDD